MPPQDLSDELSDIKRIILIIKIQNETAPFGLKKKNISTLYYSKIN